ncbi:hypothetical protein [Streptomyces sp. NPDC045251]|uniref:hypothetical protein n=1 Tax=unclassified Streptomyces TaxID=2593676 RepID=UPI00340A1543
MAGREFGHHLGLPRALSGLPLSPAVPRYDELAAAQRSAKLRHIGEAFVAPGDGLWVLDGLYVPSGPRARRRVDARFLEELAHSGAPTAALAGLLVAVHRLGPSAVRRVVLYQLIGLLQECPPARRRRTAAELGAHPDEVAGLVAAARVRPALTRRQCDAAEQLVDAWQGHRLRRTRVLLDRLPTGGDPALTALRKAVADRTAVVEADLCAARAAEENGDPVTAGEAYLRALRAAADDSRALHGLIRVHRPQPGHTAALSAEASPSGVLLKWTGDADEDGRGSHGDWLLLCLHRDGKGAVAVREVDARSHSACDAEVSLGSTVRYAALPLEGGRVAGAPLVSHRVLVAPEVRAPALTDGPGRINGVWERPDGAAEVSVERTGPDGATERLAPRPDGFTAAGLPIGDHDFHIVCHYQTPRGPVASPGVRLTRRVHPWPEPIGALTARPEGAELTLRWTGARNADVRFVAWPGLPPAPGTELSTGELPTRRDLPGSGVLRPLPGGHARVAAVAVLGDRALAGPAIDVETLLPVTGLAVRRLPDGQAAVTLDWPDGAGHLTVRWSPPDGERNGPSEHGERVVTAHAYRRGGLRLPVGPHGARIQAAAAPQVPGAVVVAAEPAVAWLAPDTVVGYEVARAPRRFLGRGRALLRVTLSTPGDGVPADVPEFVCVARDGLLRPRCVTDGATVLRIPGTSLARHGTVEQELPTAPFPAPYTLRGFLLGDRAAAVRLEEPSPATLVVR